MRVVSWNVNGLRACARKGFDTWLREARADVVGLQEVRACPEEAAAAIRLPRGWWAYWAPAERRGYSGVAILTRHEPTAVGPTALAPRFDREGRLVEARFGRLVVLNGYFPKGSGRLRDNSRIPYKLAFYRAVLRRATALRRAGRRVLVMGDFNTAHEPIDLARPSENAQNSGFRREERAELHRWMAGGWVDTFRDFEPAGGHYTWWSQRLGVRERNVGWRIDYVLASPAARRHVTRAFISADVRGSDHCPIGVDLAPAVTG